MRQQCGMNSGRTVFAQLSEHLPHKEFQRCVIRCRGDRYAKNFSGWDQYLPRAGQRAFRRGRRARSGAQRGVGGLEGRDDTV